MGLLDRFRRRRRAQAAAHTLYSQAMQQARQPVFFAELQVPDTLDGRFDVLVLHAFLLLHGLKDGGGEAEPLSQAFFDLMFRDLDRSLREMGVGDQSVGKRIKQMLHAFYGRMRAYEEALGDSERLRAALRRNVYRDGEVTPQSLARLAAYVQAEAARLQALALPNMLAGKAGFGALPPAETGAKMR